MIARMPGAKIFLVLLLSAALAAFPEPREEAVASASSYDEDALKAEARAAIKEFGPALKAELQAAMSVGGPVAAIEMCNLRAVGIAAAAGERHGFEIGRTSHRVRNPANAPDAWEAARLQEFLVAAEQGTELGALDFGAIIDSGNGPAFRYMKAIGTGPVCVACHGEALAPEVTEILDRLYPEDQARGFKAGDLRGAFTVTKKLN